MYINGWDFFQKILLKLKTLIKQVTQRIIKEKKTIKMKLFIFVLLGLIAFAFAAPQGLFGGIAGAGTGLVAGAGGAVVGKNYS